MKSIKIVARFFSKTDAKSQVSYERALAKQNGKEIEAIKIEDACQLYIADSWFKSKIKLIGRPLQGQLIVVVYCKVASVQTQPVAKPSKKVEAKSKVIRFKPAKMSVNKISPAALKAKAILISLASFNNTHLRKVCAKRISLKSLYQRIAS